MPGRGLHKAYASSLSLVNLSPVKVHLTSASRKFQVPELPIARMSFAVGSLCFANELEKIDGR